MTSGDIKRLRDIAAQDGMHIVGEVVVKVCDAALAARAEIDVASRAATHAAVRRMRRALNRRGLTSYAQMVSEAFAELDAIERARGDKSP